MVTIGSDINLNGDNGQDGVLVISGASTYTINVASGGILVAIADFNQDGIISTSQLTLANDGTISGDGLSQGIQTVGGGTSITNNGSISGSNVAIFFTTDGGTVINSVTGIIDGFTGGSNDGIQGDNNVVVTNSGSITGADEGIDIDDSGNVRNLTNFSFGIPVSGGTITGVNIGIEAGNNLTVENQLLSTISGTAPTGFGIDANDFADITNSAGATITGGLTGINADDQLFLENHGTITGTAGDGVLADEGTDISNRLGATITGGVDGVEVGNGATIFNQVGATITGTTGDGINAGGGTNIINDGVVTGGNDGIDIDQAGLVASTITNSGTVNGGDQSAFDGSVAAETLNNTGTLNGGLLNAVSMGLGDDILNLNSGSRVIGDVIGGGGIDTINFGAGLTTPGGTGNSISGDVLGFNAINKASGGTAFIGLPGDPLFNVTADTINITGGGLYINADLAGDTVAQSTINAGGSALGGRGTWNAVVNITNGGISAGAIPINLTNVPTQAVGILAITGNVTHSPGTFIRHDVIPNGTDDRINHSGGTYALGANTDIRVSATNNDTVIRDGVYTVVNSNSVITGGLPDMSVQFNPNVNDLENAAGGVFFGTLRGNTGVGNTQAVLNRFMVSGFQGVGTDLVFTVTHDFEGLGLDSNQASLGAALDDSTNSGDVLIQDFIAALDYSDLATVQAILGDFSTLDSFASASAIVSSNYQTNRVVQDHLAMTRAQAGTTSRTYVGSYAEPAPAPAPAPAMGNSFNVWGSVSYDWRDSSGFANDIDGEEASFLAGIDYRIAPNFLLGILLEGANADYDFSGGSSDVDTFRAAIYGTYGEATGFYADFLLGYGDHEFDSTRSGILGGFDTDTDAESIQAMLTFGYAMQSGGVKHGPFAGAEYTKVDVDGYNQGGILPILVDDYDVESTRLLIGYRAEAEYGRFTPYVSVAYAHELDDDNHRTTGTLPGGATFGIDGGSFDSAFLISAGTGYSITESLGLNVGYHGEISTGDGIDGHGATIGLNYAF